MGNFWQELSGDILPIWHSAYDMPRRLPLDQQNASQLPCQHRGLFGDGFE